MESWVVWTFVHKTSENQLPAALLPSAPTGTLGKAWFSGQAPPHSRPAGQQHRKCQPLSPGSWHQLPKPSWKHSARVRRALSAGLMGNPTLKQRQPCSAWLRQHSGWSGLGRQPEGRLGPSSQGSSCGSGRLACSWFQSLSIITTNSYQLLGTQSVLILLVHSFYWTPPITQQRRNCYPHLHEGPEAHKGNDLFPPSQRQEVPGLVKSPGLLLLSFLQNIPGLGK